VSTPSSAATTGSAPLRHEAHRLQLLAAEAHDHHLAAEVRVEADVAQRADGNGRARSVDRDAAAVGVLQRDDVVDVREARQQLLPDAPHREVHDARHALHGRRDREHVARAHGAVGVAVSLERVAVERLAGGRGARRERQVVERAGGRGGQHPLVHPPSRGDVDTRESDGDAVADDGFTGGDVAQRDLVRLRHGLGRHHAAA
jgi:hypothetical protein